MPQHILAFEENSLAAILDLEIRLTVLENVADVANITEAPKVSLEMMLCNASTDSRGEPERPRDQVEDLLGRETELQFERVRIGNYDLACITGYERALNAVGKGQPLSAVEATREPFELDVPQQLLGTKGNARFSEKALLGASGFAPCVRPLTLPAVP